MNDTEHDEVHYISAFQHGTSLRELHLGTVLAKGLHDIGKSFLKSFDNFFQPQPQDCDQLFICFRLA